MREFALNTIKEVNAGRTGIPITDLLNPAPAPSNHSSSTISSTVGSADWSDTDVLLGRALWSDDSADEGGEMDQTLPQDDDSSDHRSFATSSGMDFTDADSAGSALGMDVNDMDDGPEARIVGGQAASSEVPAEKTPALDATGVHAKVDAGAAENAARRGSGSGKPLKQSSLFGFLKRAGNSLQNSSGPSAAGPSNTGKRHRDGGSSESVNTVPTKKKLRKDPAPTAPNVGISRSAAAAREMNDAIKHGTFVVDPERYAEWKGKILALDPHAEFFPDDVKKVRHSTCATEVKVKTAYDATRFKAHINQDCPITHKGAGASTLKQMFGSAPRKKPPKSTPLPSKPCPGVTEHDIGDVQKYLRRSGALGGGSRSVYKIAKEKFKKAFSSLTKRRKREVLDTQQHEQTWRNDHLNLRIFSTDCQKTVPARSPRTLPCPACAALLKRKSFKRTLKKLGPKDPGNLIFTNKQWRNQVLGEIYGRSIGLKEIIEQPVRSCFVQTRVA